MASSEIAPVATPVPNSAIAAKACGLVMPISTQPGGCTAEHWAEVRSIIEEAVKTIEEPRFDVRLVSDADDVGVIQKRIVQNVYTADILVCDVSCKNPNVMFELGMRLAFDKPTVIIKDDQTDYSFDTGIIEHLTYPRDLRFGKITQFKKALGDKVLAQYKASQNPSHTTFLKNFGTFHVAALKESVASPDRIAIELLQELQAEMGVLRRDMRRLSPRRFIDRPRPSKGGVPTDILIKHVRDYISAKKPSSVQTLMDDPTFVAAIERECDAPNHYGSPEEFRADLRTAVDLHELL